MLNNITFNGEPVTLLGTEILVGNQAPNFAVTANNLEEKTLDNYRGKIKLISVVPSLDTGVCAKQTQRFNEEAEKLDNVQVVTVSMDLPFAQSRWLNEHQVKNLEIVSDHREGSFGKKYGVLIKELRLLARSIFVIDSNDKVVYVEYVPEESTY